MFALLIDQDKSFFYINNTKDTITNVSRKYSLCRIELRFQMG
jgi:hypothetical protein